jgi:hypothetical protein
MSEGVVDQFEAVQVCEQDADGRPGTLGAGQRAPERAVQPGPVGQRGQAVGGGHFLVLA